MKRFGLAIMVLILGAGTLSGCDVTANKTALIYGKYQGELSALTYEQLQNKIAGDDNFIVFQTPNSACTCWTSFRDSILQPYLESNHIRVYTIAFAQFYDINNVKRDTFGITLSASSQTLAIFKDGNLKLMREYNSTHKIWSSADSFLAYINELVIKPTIIDIDLALLQTLYAQNNTFSILYYDEGSESTFLRREFLKQYSLKNYLTMNTLYSLNTNIEGIKLDIAGEFDDEQWQTFKDSYGLSSLNNSLYGWGDGFVPTFQYIEPDGVNTNGEIIKTQAVYLNDVLTPTSAPDTYQVVESFYSSARSSVLSYLSSFEGTKVLEGLIVTGADTQVIGTSTIWQQEKAALYHDPILKAFLDERLPLVTHKLDV